ncbi:MAG: aminotransferase class V-fold PLP-dependent enzyme [Rhodospirillaceae bacterium]
MVEVIAPSNDSSQVASLRHFDVDAVRDDFPILSQPMHGKPLIYLDTAASAQKPQSVIDAIKGQYENEYANVHRGAYWLSEMLTKKYEVAREIIRDFINAKTEREIIFTKGATESINLVASSFGKSLAAGDEVVITELEHHSNIIPWQLLRANNGITLKVIPITPEGDIEIDAIEAAVSKKTKIIAVAHVSNVLGTVLPIKEIGAIARSVGARVLIDGCQGIVHEEVDVQDLDCDFYAFSGHKIYGPTGIGVLYGKEDLLNDMPPYQGGGEMISSVTFEHTEWAELPAKFEAGTPPIVPAVGLGAAVKYLESFDRAEVLSYESDLLAYGMERLQTVSAVQLVGRPKSKVAAISFVVDGAHPHDLATILDRSGICVRAGHHCAQPLMNRLGYPATLRASLGIYNTKEDIDILVKSLVRALEILC